MSRLGDLRERLWDETKEDWHLEYYQSLTEPTCPCINIEPDELSMLPPLRGYLGKSEDIAENIADAIEYLLKNLETNKRDTSALTNGER